MKDLINHIGIAIGNGVKGALILGLVFFALEYGYERFTPNNFWVEYQSTASTGRVVEGNLDMESSSIYPRGGKVIWNDRLYCDVPPGQGFTLFSSFTDNATLEPNTDFSPERWLYKGALPKEGIECYMDSTISIKTPLGWPHRTTSVSNTFPIGGAKNE